MLDVPSLEHRRRVSSGNCAFWNVSNNARSGLDYRTLADLDAPQDDDPRTEPYVVFNDNVLGNIGSVIRQGFAFIIVVDLTDHHAPWTGMEIVADDDFTSSNDLHAVEVDVVPQRYIPSNA